MGYDPWVDPWVMTPGGTLTDAVQPRGSPLFLLWEKSKGVTDATHGWTDERVAVARD